MQKFLNIFAVCCSLIALICSVKPHKNIPRWQKARHDACNITEKLTPLHPFSDKKSFVIVIASYNNETVCERNLWSVFDQTYDNYRVIYIDDCSTDKTYAKVKHFIEQKGQTDRVTLIHNPIRQMKMTNLYHAYRSCRDDEIIVCLDGDDWLAHENVLKQLNAYYQNPDIWLTYGSAINHPKFTKKDGKCLTDLELTSNSIRDLPFQLSMLRSFYAGLFKKIKLKDLFYQGKFLPSADDFAFMVAMAEMAPKHSLFIPDVLYIINDSNPIRESCVIGNLQLTMMNYLKAQPKYAPLPTTFDPTNTTTAAMKTPIDLVILSDDNPLFLSKTLPSYLAHLSGFRNISVLFSASTSSFQQAYEQLAKEFPTVSFITATSLKDVVNRNSSPYVALATDDMLLHENINLLDYVKHLENTQSVEFLLGHPGPHISGVPLPDSICATSLSNASKTPELLLDSFFAIFQKEFLNNAANTNGLINFLYTNYPNELVLFPKTSSVFPIAETNQNINKQALLKQFYEGQKNIL